MWAIVTSAVYHPYVYMYGFMVRTYIFNIPQPPRGEILIQPIFRFLGVIFDGDHDFEGPRSPKSHLDTVLRKLVTPPGRAPFIGKSQVKPYIHTNATELNSHDPDYCHIVGSF